MAKYLFQFIEKNPSPYSWLIKNERLSEYYGDLCVKHWNPNVPQMSEKLFEEIKKHKPYLVSNNGSGFYNYLFTYLEMRAGKYDRINYENFIGYSGLSDSEKANDIVFEYYLDSVRIDMKKTILPSHLKEINIVEEGNVVEAYFSSVNLNICLVNLNSISDENNNSPSSKVYIIDDEIIKKPSEYKIDKNEIENLEMTLSSEIEGQTSNFLIIKITTKSKQRRIDFSKSKDPIMIR